MARRALEFYLARKVRDFEGLAARCLGLELECLADTSRLTPGGRYSLKALLWNPNRLALSVHFEPRIRLEGAVEDLPAPPPAPWPDSPCVTASFALAVADSAAVSSPYWLTRPREGYCYSWADAEEAGAPFGPPLVELRCEVTVGGGRLALSAPAVHREAFAGGHRNLPVAVLPSLSLHPTASRHFLPAGVSGQQLDLHVVVRNQRAAEANGTLTLEVPDGWAVTPAVVPVRLSKQGDSLTARQTVTVPGGAPAGHYSPRYVVRCDGQASSVVLTPVLRGAPGLPRAADEATSVQQEFVATPAEVRVELIAASFVRRLRYAYVRGAGDQVPESLARFGLDLKELGDEEIVHIDLSAFDVVVVGPNGYLLRDELRKHSRRFLDYVERGGTLVVQYHGFDYQKGQHTPYPFHYNQPHDRVTLENVPVTLLNPDHPLFHLPNAITAADFDGWVRDRGLYFFGEWDARYEPLVSCSDPGEGPKHGALLVAGYGRGTYVYTGLSLFRQLAAGVHGAFRLFANLLALPEARARERAERLRGTELFASLSEDQLYSVARIMSLTQVEDGAYLCHEGDQGEEMYIVVSGEVEVLKERPEPKTLFLARPGTAIGEFAALTSVPRTAALRARGPAQLLVINGPHFRGVLRDHPEISFRVIEMLIRKLKALTPG